MFGINRLDVIISVGCLLYCIPLIQCHRTDVYIAGFFPYGAGKENSETGKFSADFRVFSKRNGGKLYIVYILVNTQVVE